MSDFFENFSDGIEDDAGGLAAMGGLAALSNQRASLKKLSGIQEQLEKSQAASAKTEKERLAIEKQRLKLQQAQIEEQKFTAESVKELRILMADADTLFERMSQMAAAPSGGGDTYDLDLTRTAALIQVKLELIEKNSEVLSDLADLKEQRRLKSHFEKQLSESATLRHLPEDPLSFVEREVFDQLQHIWSAFVPVEELSNKRALKDEGGSKALDFTGYIISEEKLLNLKERLTKALERLDQVKIRSGVAGRFTNDHFEETKILWGQFYFLKGKKPDLDFSGAVDYLKRVIEDPEFKLQMEGVGADASVAIESHITLARDQDAMLRDAEHRISLGDFDLARSVEQIPKAERYANPLFAENHSRLAELDNYIDCFLPSIDFSAAYPPPFSKKIQQAWDVLGVESWANNSDLKQRILKNKNAVLEIISKRERKNTIVWTVMFVVTACVFGWAFIEGKKHMAEQGAEIKATEAIQEKKKAAEAEVKVVLEAARKAAQAEVKAAEAARKAAAVRLIDEVGAARKAAEAEMKAAEPQASANHSDVGTKFAKAMTGIMEGMGSITDVKSAEDFVKTMEGANATLKEALAVAEALDPPTDEEKEAMKAIKEGLEGEYKGQAIGQKMFQMVAENPDGEAIGAVLIQGLNNPQLKEIGDKLYAIYGLEDEELEIGE